jgi:modulator of FtsH protease
MPEAGFRPESWQILYAAIAGAAAALTGLLFVAFSLNLRIITSSPMHMGRSRETLATLLILLMISIAVLIPDQPNGLLGTELILGGLLVIVTSVRNQMRTLSMLDDRTRKRWSRRNLLLNAGTVAIVVAGLSLVLGEFGGLYWLLLTIAIYFPWAVINAWVLVVGVAQTPKSSGTL